MARKLGVSDDNRVSRLYAAGLGGFCFSESRLLAPVLFNSQRGARKHSFFPEVALPVYSSVGPNRLDPCQGFLAAVHFGPIPASQPGGLGPRFFATQLGGELPLCDQERRSSRAALHAPYLANFRFFEWGLCRLQAPSCFAHRHGPLHSKQPPVMQVPDYLDPALWRS